MLQSLHFVQNDVSHTTLCCSVPWSLLPTQQCKYAVTIRIPEGEAKEHADLMAARCTAEYFMSHKTNKENEIDKVLFDASFWPDLFKKSDRYRDETMKTKRTFEVAKTLKEI